MCLTCAFINPFGGDWLHERDEGRILTETTDVPGGTTTTVQLLPGDTFNGSLSFAGDWDWFYVEYEAGVTYTVTMTPGTLLDPLLAIADENGAILDIIDFVFDGGTETFTFTAPVSGSGYLIADSFYNFINTSAPDWGTDIGTYTLTITTGDAPPPPPPSSNDPLDAITWNYTAPDVINVYFVPGAMSFDDIYMPAQTTSAWSAYEIQQAQLAFDTFEAVANVTFNFVTNPAQADFFMVESTDPDSSLGYWGVAGGTPTLNGTPYTLDGWGVFFNGGQGWTTQGQAQGGFGFITIIHEIGHGLGLAHPHDDGGGSPVMNGVTSALGSLGDFSLNQGINTTMTYNDGWQTAPHGFSPSLDYGFQATPMAFDIAVLQEKYGANMSTNTGNDSYVLPTGNGAGTFYAAIWDAGGTDTLTHNGSAAAVLDLRAATLTYALGGGGFVSYVVGIHGGFTIAANVMIENASGGAGNDTITGNDADNLIAGNDGHDIIAGGAGDDTISGGAGNDTLLGGAGADTIDGGLGNDSLVGESDNDTLIGGAGFDRLIGGDGDDSLLGGDQADNLYGDAGNDTLSGDDGNDRLFGGAGADSLLGGEGRDLLIGENSEDTLDGGAGDDRLFGGAGFDLLRGGDGDDSLDGGAQADNLYGEAGNDTLLGGDGSDRLFGGDGDDSLSGGTANDALFGEAGNDTLAGNAGFDVLRGGNGDDSLSGGAQADNLFGDFGNDTLDGGDGFDRLFGGAGNDLLIAGGGNDALFAEAGNDTLEGGEGNDRLYAGGGFDRLEGGAGDDQLWGNFNWDIFIFADGHGQDTIQDFEAINRWERIDLSGISALSGIANYDALELSGAVTASGGCVLIDTGGGNSILLAGVSLTDLDNTDFIF